MSDSMNSDPAAGDQKRWVRAPLSRFLALSVRTVAVDPGQDYATVGVLNKGRGLLYREPISGRSTSYKNLNRIGPGLLIYSRLKAFEGAIAVTPNDLPESFASQEFPTFAFTPEADPDFFRILITTSEMWSALQSMSKGMGGRRERVKASDFLSIVMNIPPISLQKRIVGVIGAVDDHIAALDREETAADSAASAMAESMLASSTFVPLKGRICRIEGGRSPQAVDRIPAEHEPGVLKVSAVKPFQFSADESKTLAPGTEMPNAAEVRAGDVLVTRASGTIHRVGAACRVPSDVRSGLYLSDKTLRIVPDDGLDPNFLVVAMALSRVRSQIAIAASGSASMKNISQSKIVNLEIPMPDLAEQRKVAKTILSMRSVGRACRAESHRIRQFRAALLSGLLDRTIDIESAGLGV
ncbi:hypothetical protein [Cryptosporangium phraense]|uniref:Restriction endonuclease subunit S n=1 Tax=Cryptosporangium phraense TaxID=2593070 RepID=A0A545AKH9_9ACTN|nr:hypothetical protein [Cryptosporangium phraense]TQS41824.1 hypothetical protein FL583_27715 [Cryptosporangium phraense]